MHNLRFSIFLLPCSIYQVCPLPSPFTIPIAINFFIYQLTFIIYHSHIPCTIHHFLFFITIYQLHFTHYHSPCTIYQLLLFEIEHLPFPFPMYHLLVTSTITMYHLTRTIYQRPLTITMYYWIFRIHWVPWTMDHLPFTMYNLQFTICHLPLPFTSTIDHYHLPPTIAMQRLPITIYHFILTISHVQFNVYHLPLPFTSNHHHLTFTIFQVPLTIYH